MVAAGMERGLPAVNTLRRSMPGDANSTLTRRRLIQTGSAGAAAAALATAGPAAAATTKPKPRHADVIVVGAGYAGLTAAHRVAAAGKSVIVLEARNRVGGRSYNHPLPGGEWTELGATFVGPTQDHVIGLAKEMDVGLFPTYDEGNNVYRQDGMNLEYSDTGPLGTAPPDPTVLADVTLTVAQLDDMSTKVPIDAPWTAQSAVEWDSQSLQTWIENNTTPNPRFRDLIQIATEPIFGAEARQLSLLYVLFYIAASGNEKNPGTFERNFNTRGGAQQQRMLGGTQLVPIRLARRLGKKHVLLNAPARRIVQTKTGVRVESDNFDATGKRVILAVPPPLLRRIGFQPALPETRRQLTKNMPMGFLMKAEVFYDKPFWRAKGLTGQGLSDEGPITATFDISPLDGKPGILMCFIGGDRGKTFAKQSAAARRSAVLKSLAQLYGSEALKPTEYLEFSWVTQPWTRGCPVSLLAPKTLLRFGSAMRKPVGRIHWAGTETSTFWCGYLDGATRSGERAAAEVLEQI
jgi:monoamine oxidase